MKTCNGDGREMQTGSRNLSLWPLFKSVPLLKKDVFWSCSNISSTILDLTDSDKPYIGTSLDNYPDGFTEARYHRTLEQGKWGTIVLPFTPTAGLEGLELQGRKHRRDGSHLRPQRQETRSTSEGTDKHHPHEERKDRKEDVLINDNDNDNENHIDMKKEYVRSCTKAIIIKTAQVLCMSNEFYINEDDGLEKFVDVKEDILPEEDFSDTFSGWE